MSVTTIPSAPASRGGKDIGFAVGIILILCLFFLPVPATMIDFGLAFSIAISVLILMVGLWIQKPLEFSAFPTVSARRDHPQARAQHLDDKADPLARRRGADLGRLYHRRLRPTRHGRRLPHRHHRLSHPGDDQLPRHHQGRDPHRRSRRPLHPRRDPRQADGDRRRPVGGPHRRKGRSGTPARTRGGERLLRLDGRRVEIRARRRDRRTHHSCRQHFRRHRHRRHAARSEPLRRGRHLHQALGRRRPRDADPRADHLARRGPAGRQGRHARLGRQGGHRPAQRLSERALSRGPPHGDAGRRPGPAVPAVCDARRP